MYKIGLTGGIASGKTTASGILRALGAEVIDADEIARGLTADGGAAAENILKRFGTLDRAALARIIFTDEAARFALNAIVHPLVYSVMRERIEHSQARIVVLDVPLLYESGMENLADEVWVVHVPEALQIERMRARGLTKEQARQRIKSQMPTAEKVRRADHAIDASGTKEALKIQIEPLWREAERKAEAAHDEQL